jgi:hypothetical protein
MSTDQKHGPKPVVNELNDEHPQKLLMRLNELTEQHAKLTERTMRLEKALMELTTVNQMLSAKIFESIGRVITDIGLSYQQRTASKIPDHHRRSGVTIKRVPDEEPSNDRSLWVRLNHARNAEAGIWSDEKGFQVHDCPEDLLLPVREWLIHEQVPVEEAILVNIYTEQPK